MVSSNRPIVVFATVTQSGANVDADRGPSRHRGLPDPIQHRAAPQHTWLTQPSPLRRPTLSLSDSGEPPANFCCRSTNQTHYHNPSLRLTLRVARKSVFRHSRIKSSEAAWCNRAYSQVSFDLAYKLNHKIAKPPTSGHIITSAAFIFYLRG